MHILGRTSLILTQAEPICRAHEKNFTIGL